MDGAGATAATTAPNAGTTAPNAALGSGAPPPPFLSKTYEMVDDPATDAIVSWGPGNNSFVVWNTPEFARDLLPKYFKHNNFSSFVRQLNTYGFRKVDPDRWEFANEGFLRGQKHLLKNIARRKPSHPHSQPLQTQAQNGSACVEVGKFGLEEEIERLKRDKTVLMKELVMLRQQQQTTDHQLQTLGQRLQGMEQRQQQMMSFLAKAMQSPGFLAQLVQQQNDSNRCISGGTKKRRLPKQEDKLDGEEGASLDGQIIKYQPLMNEAAKAMLMQILKMDTDSQMESMGNSGSYLIKNFPGSNSSSRNSSVTLSEMPASSVGTPYMPVSSGLSTICSSSTASEIQSNAADLPDISMLSTVPEAISSCPTDMDIPGFSPTDIPEDRNFESLYMDGESFSPDAEIEIFDGDQRLPDINDAFWEQFLSGSPISGETEEVVSGMQEATTNQTELDSSWTSAQNLAQLSEQMGLLSSQGKD